MTPEKFIYKVVELYRHARKATVPNRLVRRGRSHAVSSKTEDLLADFLVKNDKKIEKIYVDQPITILDRGKKWNIYPDLLIIKKGKITAFMDLKMDLGFARNKLYSICLQHNKNLLRMRGNRISLKDGLTKEYIEYRVSSKATYDVVIISSRNINKDQLNIHINRVKRIGNSTKVFVLVDGHPNEYNKKIDVVMKKISIRFAEFERLLGRLGNGK